MENGKWKMRDGKRDEWRMENGENAGLAALPGFDSSPFILSLPFSLRSLRLCVHE